MSIDVSKGMEWCIYDLVVALAMENGVMMVVPVPSGVCRGGTCPL